MSIFHELQAVGIAGLPSPLQTAVAVQVILADIVTPKALTKPEKMASVSWMAFGATQPV